MIMMRCLVFAIAAQTAACDTIDAPVSTGLALLWTLLHASTQALTLSHLSHTQSGTTGTTATTGQLY
jgi:hypothetical protein